MIGSFSQEKVMTSSYQRSLLITDVSEPGANAVDSLGRYTIYLVIGFLTAAIILRIRSAVDRYRMRKELDAPPKSNFPESTPGPDNLLPISNVDLEADPFA